MADWRNHNVWVREDEILRKLFNLFKFFNLKICFKLNLLNIKQVLELFEKQM
jgi:hypothetical protein